ncbi:hypothetical protein CPB86DRAFT_811073 [Serendipita vermifera]|nr:hypothetical protein CPB86DRAFT_811073 [Serendipita vermifera]
MTDISALLDQSIFEPIDPNITQEAINKSPFIPIPGVFNFRDLGGLPIVDPNTVSIPFLRNSKIQMTHQANWHASQNDVISGVTVRTGRLFRSAQFNSITPEGKEKLFELDVGVIFDFRTTMEIRREARLPQDADVKSGIPEFKRPKPSHDFTPTRDVAADDIEEIRVRHNPLKDVTQHKSQELMKVLTQLNAGDEGMIGVYEDILTDGGESFGNIMKFLLEQAKKEVSEDVVEEDSNVWGGRACVWNCHVGKDRTGVFSALLLSLLGVPDMLIAHDYALTRIGLEPLREALATQFKDLSAVNQVAARTLGSSRASNMMRLLELLRTKYGGARGYFKEYSELTDEELDTIRSSLIVSSQEQV